MGYLQVCNKCLAPCQRLGGPFGQRWQCAECQRVYTFGKGPLSLFTNTTEMTPEVYEYKRRKLVAPSAPSRHQSATPTMTRAPQSAGQSKSVTPDIPLPMKSILGGCLLLGIIFVAVGIMYAAANVMSLPAFWGLVGFCVLGLILLRKRIAWKKAWPIVALGFVAAGILFVAIINANSVREQSALAVKHAASRAEMEAQQALAGHNKRLAWNKAHPAQAAERFRKQRALQAQASRDEQAAIAANQPQIDENNRIASIPYDTRLSNAKTEFDQLAGSHGVFASATILDTYIRDSKFVVMVDQAGWDGASEAERDGYLTTIRQDWSKACTDNHACDPDNIYSGETSKSLGYQFTSYFDSH